MNWESVESERALDEPSTIVALPPCAGERNAFLLGSPDHLAAPGPRPLRRRSTTARWWGSTPNLHEKLFDRDRFHDLAYMKRRLAPPCTGYNHAHATHWAGCWCWPTVLRQPQATLMQYADLTALRRLAPAACA